MEKESALITPTNKSFFKYINSKLNINKHANGLLNDDGTVTSDPFEIAKMFNDYFASLYTIENETNPNFEIAQILNWAVSCSVANQFTML